MKSDPEKTDYWRQHVEAVKSSGLTRKAYCEANQIKKSSFDYWCHTLSYLKRNANGGIAHVRVTAANGRIPVRGCVSLESEPGNHPQGPLLCGLVSPLPHYFTE